MATGEEITPLVSCRERLAFLIRRREHCDATEAAAAAEEILASAAPAGELATIGDVRRAVLAMRRRPRPENGTAR